MRSLVLLPVSLRSLSLCLFVGVWVCFLSVSAYVGLVLGRLYTPAVVGAVEFVCVYTSGSAALTAVRENEVLGVFMTGSLSMSERIGLRVVHTRVFSSFGPWLRRTDTPRCLAKRFKKDLRLLQREVPEGSSPATPKGQASAATHYAAAARALPIAAVAAAVAVFGTF